MRLLSRFGAMLRGERRLRIMPSAGLHRALQLLRRMTPVAARDLTLNSALQPCDAPHRSSCGMHAARDGSTVRLAVHEALVRLAASGRLVLRFELRLALGQPLTQGDEVHPGFAGFGKHPAGFLFLPDMVIDHLCEHVDLSSEVIV